MDTPARIRSICYTIGVAGLLMILLPFAFITAQALEGKHFPVTSDVRVQLLKADKDKMTFEAQGRKVRNCALIDVKVLVDKTGEGAFKRGVIVLDDSDPGPRVLPLGVQYLGKWNIYPPGNAVSVEAHYSCHPFWDTVVTLGTWDADEPPQLFAPSEAK